MFNMLRAVEARKARIKNICDHFQISTIYAQNMSIDEVEWFERKIAEVADFTLRYSEQGA